MIPASKAPQEDDKAPAWEGQSPQGTLGGWQLAVSSRSRHQHLASSILFLNRWCPDRESKTMPKENSQP